MCIVLHIKYQLFLSDFNETWISMTDFRKYFKVPNIMNIRSVGAELFYADRGMDWWADMTKLVVAFCSLANVPKKKANFHTAANKLPMKITFLRMHISWVIIWPSLCDGSSSSEEWYKIELVRRRNTLCLHYQQNQQFTGITQSILRINDLSSLCI